MFGRDVAVALGQEGEGLELRERFDSPICPQRAS
jgi:hypothetical protein